MPHSFLTLYKFFSKAEKRKIPAGEAAAPVAAKKAAAVSAATADGNDAAKQVLQ